MKNTSLNTQWNSGASETPFHDANTPTLCHIRLINPFSSEFWICRDFQSNANLFQYSISLYLGCAQREREAANSIRLRRRRPRCRPNGKSLSCIALQQVSRCFGITGFGISHVKPVYLQLSTGITVWEYTPHSPPLPFTPYRDISLISEGLEIGDVEEDEQLRANSSGPIEIHNQRAG